jgi:hypothetical protein
MYNSHLKITGQSVVDRGSYSFQKGKKLFSSKIVWLQEESSLWKEADPDKSMKQKPNYRGR